RAVKTGTTIVDNDLRATMPDGPFSQQLGMQCLLAIPLIARQGPTGCLIIGDTQRKRRFNQEAADEAMLLGPLASSALERARLFADVQLREEHFRSLIENAADVIAVVRPDATIQYQSPSSLRILGWTPEEMVGRSILDFLYPADMPRMMDMLRQVM